jgi:hypothetical protein
MKEAFIKNLNDRFKVVIPGRGKYIGGLLYCVGSLRENGFEPEGHVFQRWVKKERSLNIKCEVFDEYCDH